MRRVVAAGFALVMPLAVASAALPACKGPMAKIEGLRDALASDDATAVRDASRGLPSCPDAPPVALVPDAPSPLDRGCLSEIADALGSKKGFSPRPPDHAALATAAVLVARDRRGDQVAHADLWLGALKSGQGPGPDALRAAVARAMAEVAPAVGRPLEQDAEARAAMKVIASAIPGACPTYRMLGRGDDLATMRPELGPDHATCVHRDLARREGPGASYGSGVFRGLEGALALWRETERALRLGAPSAVPAVKSSVETKLAIIERATRQITTRRLASTAPQATLDVMGDLHAQAGIKLWPDAGAEASVVVGIPTAPSPPPLRRDVAPASP